VQTQFAPEQLADPKLQSLEKILRSCVHCGFCTATCPTYVIGGDERDSPRGRIYLIKDLLETGRAPSAEDVAPIDHCLSCYSCMTTCPSGVDYRRLVDASRVLIEKRYRRGFADRLLRETLAWTLTSPARFRFALWLAKIGRPFRPLIAGLPGVGRQMAAMLELAPVAGGADPGKPRSATSATAVRGKPGLAPPATKRPRVALLAGCVQQVLAPEINAATARVLERLGYEVVRPKGETCCGSMWLHMGREEAAHRQMRANVDAFFSREVEAGGLEAILITASGCGSTFKDYGVQLADDPAYAAKAQRVAALAKDPSEFFASLDLKFSNPQKLVVAYHAACSLQHAQQITEAPKALLRRAGFQVRTPAEAHLCCGSAGTYNILQSEMAEALKARKLKNLERLKADVIAAGNIGCLTHLATGATVPVMHMVELLDWAMGGPKPAALGKP
jgi:glycolate oxidase iron-sulfur subunit